MSFAGMMAEEAPAQEMTGSAYTVVLDKQGHTVNMQIQPPLAVAAPLAFPAAVLSAPAQPAVYLSHEQIADVAARIASEMTGGKRLVKPFAAAGAAVPDNIAQQLVVMQRRINCLQHELQFDAQQQPDPVTSMPPVKLGPATSGTSGPSARSQGGGHDDELGAGLRHHAGVLRATQNKIDQLESEMALVMSVAAEQGQSLAKIDVGLRSHKSAIEASSHELRQSDSRLSAAEKRMVRFDSNIEQQSAAQQKLEARCVASLGSLRSEYVNFETANSRESAGLKQGMQALNAGMHNHKDEIRRLRGGFATEGSANEATQSQLHTLQVGLLSQQAEVTKLQTAMHSSQHISSQASAQAAAQMSARLSAEAASHRAEMHTHLDQLSAGLNNHKTEIRSLKTQHSAHSVAPNSADAVKLEALEAGVCNHQAEIRSLKTSLNLANSRTSASSGETSMHIEALHAGMQNHMNEIRSLKSSASGAAAPLRSAAPLRAAAPLQSSALAGPAVSEQLLGMQARLDAM